MNIETAYIECCNLIDAFEKHQETFMSKNYDEAKVRQSFINPFFENVLGWDVSQRKEKNPKLTEVTVEESQRQKREEGLKKVDYAFHTVTDNQKKISFFVEAKQPSVQIKSESPYLQIKNYARTAYLPISILTDFEQFHIVDCRAKISKTNILDGDNKELYFTDFRKRENFDFLYNLLNRDAVYNGSIDKYVTALKKVKGYQTARDPLQIIGDEFLNYIEELRKYIAQSLKYNNSSLNSEQLTETTHRIIDRLVFVRFLEDKNIEHESWIKKWAENKKPYTAFVNDCKKFDGLYNGIIFKKHSIVDNLSFIEDEEWFAEVCKEMIDPYSPYKFNFNYIPVYILGSVYERFLGSIIHSTAEKAEPILKPEVRKAGGVYYTPEYVVQYIVSNTVGGIIRDKKPKEIKELKFADIACGSGSFLIGIYDYLLQYYNAYYNKHTSEAKKEGCIEVSTNQYRLNIKQKRDILLNNIFGNDIDAQAVEVTQLSLFLKMLEDETQETLNVKGNVLFQGAILPDLKRNIVSGNSLIGSDFKYELFTDEGKDKINTMDYKVSFPAIMKQNGGFDAIVGNPPYVTLQLGKKQESQDEKIMSYYKTHYPASFDYKVNLYALFIEKAMHLLKDNSPLSFIVPNTFYTTDSFKNLRKLMLNNGTFDIIMDLRYKVFEDAEIGGSAVFSFIKNGYIENSKKISVDNFTDFKNHKIEVIPHALLVADKDYNLLLNKKDDDILSKVKTVSGIVELGSITKVYQGIITGDNKKYISNTKKSDIWQPILKGRDINKYSTTFNNNFVYYSINDLWSNTDIKMFKVAQKIISRQTSDRLIATIDRNQYFSLDSTHVIHLLVEDIAIEYLLGLYNSTLINYFYQSRVKENSRVFAQVKTVNIKPLPIKKIDNENISEKEKHDEIVLLVSQLLQYNEQLQSIIIDSKIEKLKMQIEYNLDRIDELVYQLYELTPEEIEIVENEI